MQSVNDVQKFLFCLHVYLFFSAFSINPNKSGNNLFKTYAICYSQNKFSQKLIYGIIIIEIVTQVVFTISSVCNKTYPSSLALLFFYISPAKKISP